MIEIFITISKITIKILSLKTFFCLYLEFARYRRGKKKIIFNFLFLSLTLSDLSLTFRSKFQT